MKSREQQGEFNIKLMQSLERIKKKLDKESGLSKSGSHRRTKSDSRHHQHSPMRSNKRAYNNSSLSHVRKHERSGEDELRGEMNKIKPPMFDEEHIFNCIIILHTEGRISIYQLKGKASMWWDHLV
jgi:hypothetical protein